jgi:hypothetical protein
VRLTQAWRWNHDNRNAVAPPAKLGLVRAYRELRREEHQSPADWWRVRTGPRDLTHDIFLPAAILAQVRELALGTYEG